MFNTKALKKLRNQVEALKASHDTAMVDVGRLKQELEILRERKEAAIENKYLKKYLAQLESLKSVQASHPPSVYYHPTPIPGTVRYY